MFSRIEGTVLERTGEVVRVDTGGLAYDVVPLPDDLVDELDVVSICAGQSADRDRGVAGGIVAFTGLLGPPVVIVTICSRYDTGSPNP